MNEGDEHLAREALKRRKSTASKPKNLLANSPPIPTTFRSNPSTGVVSNQYAVSDLRQQEEVSEELNRVDIEEFNRYGETLLHMAAKNGCNEAAGLFLSHGASTKTPELQQKSKADNTLRLENNLKECQNSFKETEKTLIARCELLEKDKSRLELEIKDVLKELNLHEDENDVFCKEVESLERRLKHLEVRFIVAKKHR
ncbi:hypothetical protein L2E82_13482 [Cichorium intybus]|uniref:Uncharacterized protein n=1 Tax=Cichorium intybus TaxID=13427 RepID=A0ACB9EYR8_CICIN|nr:hypothetical protein L2E82_13482 [Cichorium intybus]